jgi:Tfp pilus assembly protein PilO
MTEMRKWSLGTLVVVLVAVLAAWFLLISPKRSEAASLEEQTAAQIDANATLQTQIALLQEQAKDLPEKQAELAALDAKIPSDAQLPSLIRELSDSAAKAGVDLTTVTPAPPVPYVAAPTGTTVTTVPAATNLLQINLTINASGGYFELQQFFNQLERMDRALLVTNASITETEATGTDGTGEAVTSSGSLTATITGQVFVASDVPVATTPAATSGDTSSDTPIE